MAKLGQAVAAAKSEYGSAAARLEELRQRLKECDREIGALAAEKANLACQLTDLAVEKKKLQHKYRTCACCCCYFCWQNHFDVCALNVSNVASRHGHQCCARKGVERHGGGGGGAPPCCGFLCKLCWRCVSVVVSGSKHLAFGCFCRPRGREGGLTLSTHQS